MSSQGISRYFEFIRFEDLDGYGKPAPYADAVPLEQVEIGQRYTDNPSMRNITIM